MDKGILILAHGSRAKEADTTLNKIVEKMSRLMEGCLVQKANMEFSKPNLLEGLEYLVEKGVKQVIIVPLFLFKGRHIQHDIPALVSKAREKFPKTNIKIAKHIDADDRLVEILANRAREAMD